MPITVSNRQRRVRVELGPLRQFAEKALVECMKLQKRRLGSLADLPSIDVVLISDRRIAALHRRFMDDPTPTDVITFDHGEIFVSTDTAKRQARQYRTTIAHELRLYLVHGLLHLAGFDDKTAAGAQEMKRLQERIVAR